MSDEKVENPEVKEERVDKFRELQLATKRLAQTKNGQIFLAYLCNTCGVFKPSVSFTQSGLDVEALSYNEGRRSVYISAVRPLLQGSSALDKIERPEVI